MGVEHTSEGIVGRHTHNAKLFEIIEHSGSRQGIKMLTKRRCCCYYINTFKIPSMHKALYHRDDIDRLYDIDRLHVSRKEGRRGLASVEDSVDASI